MNKYIKSSAALLLGSSLLLGACGNEDDNKTTDVSNVKTSVEDAIKTAQKEAKGDLESISFDYDEKEKKWAYEVNLKDASESSEVKIDSDSNKVLKKVTEKDNDKETTIVYGDVTPIEDIIDVAKKKFDGEVKEWSLDEDSGVIKYDVELVKDKKSQEFENDAQSKKILKQES